MHSGSNSTSSGKCVSGVLVTCSDCALTAWHICVPHDADRCIQVTGLRKVFGGGESEVVAVDNVNMEMYENQVRNAKTCLVALQILTDQ